MGTNYGKVSEMVSRCIPLEKMMELKGKHIVFKNKSKTYENMNMESKRRFYLQLESKGGI